MIRNLKENLEDCGIFIVSVAVVILILLLGISIVLIPMGFIYCLGMAITESFILAKFLYTLGAIVCLVAYIFAIFKLTA